LLHSQIDCALDWDASEARIPVSPSVVAELRTLLCLKCEPALGALNQRTLGRAVLEGSSGGCARQSPAWEGSIQEPRSQHSEGSDDHRERSDRDEPTAPNDISFLLNPEFFGHGDS
jgi:hypothetical protein